MATAKRRKLVYEDFDLGFGGTTIPTDSGGIRTATKTGLHSFAGAINPIHLGAVGDGVVDDTTAIQNALTNGDVWLPPGYTFLVSGLTVPSDRRLWGSWQSTLKLKASTDSPVLTCEDTTDWVIDGIRIDGNKAFQTGTTTAGIFVKGGKKGSIVNCRFEDTRIESVLISKNESSGEVPDNIVVANNVSINSSYSGGFRQHYAVTAGKNITIANNVGESTDGFAATLVDIEPNNASNPIEDVSITGNVGRTVSGVWVTSSHGQIIKRVTVANNTCLGFGAGRGSAYIIKGALYVTFAGNVGDSAGTNGLVVESSDFVSVTGNTLRNYAVDATASNMDGIQLTTATSVTISGNTLQSSEASAYGIRETASDCITYVGNNRLDVTAGNQVSLSSTASVLNWRTFDKSGNRYGDTHFLSALGAASKLSLEWTSSAGLLRPAGGATLEFRPTTMLMSEITDQSAPSSNNVIIYARDTGGKTELVARFPTGAIQRLAIEP